MFYIGAVSLLISTKKITAPKGRREGRKLGDSSGYQCTKDYEAICPACGYSHVIFSLPKPSYLSLGTYYTTLERIGHHQYSPSLSHTDHLYLYHLGNVVRKRNVKSGTHRGGTFSLHFCFSWSPISPLSRLWCLAWTHWSVWENVCLLQLLNKTNIHFPRWNCKRNMKANCT